MQSKVSADLPELELPTQAGKATADVGRESESDTKTFAEPVTESVNEPVTEQWDLAALICQQFNIAHVITNHARLVFDVADRQLLQAIVNAVVLATYRHGQMALSLEQLAQTLHRPMQPLHDQIQTLLDKQQQVLAAHWQQNNSPHSEHSSGEDSNLTTLVNLIDQGLF